jgi:hypothetical protein
VDEVPHHQEVAGEAHLLDDAEFVGEASLDDVSRSSPVPQGQTLAGEVLEIALQRVVLGHGVARQMEAAELQREVAPLRHGQRVAAGFGGF